MRKIFFIIIAFQFSDLFAHCFLCDLLLIYYEVRQDWYIYTTTTYQKKWQINKLTFTLPLQSLHTDVLLFVSYEKYSYIVDSDNRPIAQVCSHVVHVVWLQLHILATIHKFTTLTENCLTYVNNQQLITR